MRDYVFPKKHETSSEYVFPPPEDQGAEIRSLIGVKATKKIKGAEIRSSFGFIVTKKALGQASVLPPKQEKDPLQRPRPKTISLCFRFICTNSIDAHYTSLNMQVHQVTLKQRCVIS